jgi:outer membrane protein assembly factor BamD (BamD/ComL family)
LAILGRTEEAATQYQRVLDASGDDIYGEMARLGLAEAHLTAGRYSDAISLLEGRTGSLESSTPVDAVLMRLGRAYQLAGQSEDALAAFTRVVEEFPVSVYYTNAKQEVEALRQGGSDTSDE